MMSRPQKHILVPDRLRTLPAGGFSWIDRRFIREGFAERLPGPEILLYFFLCAVADKHGLSYFGDTSVCGLLKISRDRLSDAREGLVLRDLLRYEPPLYQVLSLPSKTPSSFRLAASGEPRTLGEILRRSP